jgi:hypothetical protein
VPEQEASEQVAPKQNLLGPLSEWQLPKTNQSMLEQTTAIASSMLGGLPNATARGKAAAMSSITGLNPEQKQVSAERAAETDDDVNEEI